MFNLHNGFENGYDALNNDLIEYYSKDVSVAINLANFTQSMRGKYIDHFFGYISSIKDIWNKDLLHYFDRMLLKCFGQNEKSSNNDENMKGTKWKGGNFSQFQISSRKVMWGPSFMDKTNMQMLRRYVFSSITFRGWFLE